MRGRVGLGSRVVVVGAGPMGLLHIELARALGASKVVVTELMSNRREKALEVGADNAVDPTTVDPVQEVVALTGGLGADLVIIAVENTAALEQGIRMVGKQGTAIVFAGFHPSRDIKLDANLVHYGEICITGSSDFPMYLFPKALEMIDSRRVHVKSLISHTFSIERIGEGFRTALGLKGFKVVIRP
jgi:L-iditol 2-dehydrogenase